jgi:hypothetical protein
MERLNRCIRHRRGARKCHCDMDSMPKEHFTRRAGLGIVWAKTTHTVPSTPGKHPK